MVNKAVILDTIKNHLNISTGKDFAKFLGIKPTTLSMWYKRNMFDIELIFNKCEYINAEYLLTGKGEMLLSSKKKLDDPGERTEDLKYIIELQKDKIDLLEKENRILKKEIESTTDYYIAAEPSTQLKKP